MAKFLISQPLICAILAMFMVSLTLGSSEVPFIVAHKKASLSRQKSGAERVLVSVDIYNQGSIAAYDVILSDDTWPRESFDVHSGNLSTSWERLDAGGVVSHSFELEAKEKVLFHGAPAVITFRIPTESTLKQAYSTPILPLDILAEKVPEQKLHLVKRLLAKYGSLISVITIITLFVYLIATPAKSPTSKGSKKKR